METQPTKLDKILKASIIFSVLLFSCSIAYYLLIFKQNEVKKEKEEKEEIKACLPTSLEKVKEINGDREDANYYFKKCLREKGLTME